MGSINSRKIVVCDDSLTNVLIVSKILEQEGFREITTFTDPRKALAYIQTPDNSLDLLILDIEMPHITGIQLLEKIALRERALADQFSVIIISGSQDKDTKYAALISGASDFIAKPIDPIEVALRVRNTLYLQDALQFQINAAATLEKEVAKRTKELDVVNASLVEMLAMAGEMRDNETGRHVERVGKYTGVIARGLGLPHDLCFILEKAAPLHDVGKIAVSDQVLLKPGKLTEEEFASIRKHPERGYRLLSQYSSESHVLELAASIALSHHEKWDGTGYPKGISRESIPLEGRIVAICDVFDALTAARPYKEPWSTDRVLPYFDEESGKHFDPAIVKVFKENFEAILEVRDALKD